MTKITTAEAQRALAETLRQVASKRIRVVVSNRGKDFAAIVPIEDLAALEAMEDRLDVELARKALAEAKKRGEKPISWAKVKKELGL